MSSLFITVGSTLFPSLTDLALSPAFLEVLASHGVTEVTVQYGSADITVPPSGQNGRMNGKGEGSFVFMPNAGGVAGAHQGAVALAQRDGLRVRFMRYTSQFDAEVAGADMVISHAGSILSALRAHKPLLVIPNNSLMDNHQSELANALDKEGYMGVSSVQTLLDDLPAFFTRARAHISAAETSDDKQNGWHADQQAYRPFPELATGRFASILDDVAGFSA